MENSKGGAEWQGIEEALGDLEWVKDEALLGEQRDEAAHLLEKYHRCQSLHSKLSEEGYSLQRQYLALMKEKVIYATLLGSMHELGNNLGWQPELLRRVRPLIEAGKARLGEAKSKPNGAQRNS